MKYYLSSYKLGNETNILKELIDNTSKKFGYIPNALDFTSSDPVRKKLHTDKDMEDLKSLGAEVELLDLKNFFGKELDLSLKLEKLSGVYVSGGNSFILRQSMYLSGFDKIISEISKNKTDFVYIAYSAGVCVLTPSMKPYEITDDTIDMPYPEIKEQIWEGIGILNFTFEPHYKSNHPESESIDKGIQYCIDNKILFKAYRDGEVLIIK